MKMKTADASIILSAALLLSACSDAATGRPTAPRPFTEFDTLTLEQSACLYDCPVFEVAIFADGRVRHSGPTFDQTGGPVESRIGQPGLANIAKALSDARIDQMHDSYAEGKGVCEHSLSDQSILTIRVRRQGGQRNKTVAFYTGCMSPAVPSARIAELTRAIDKVTGTGALVEQRQRVRKQKGLRPLL